MPTFPRVIIATLILCIAAVPFRAAADAAADARKQFQAIYNKDNAAVMRGDLMAALYSTTQDFVSIDTKGRKTTRSEMEKKIPQVLGLMKDIKSNTTVTKVILTGKNARVMIKEHAEATITNQQTKKPGKFVVDGTGEDLWTKTGQGWKKKSSRSLTLKQSLDGKRIPVT